MSAPDPILPAHSSTVPKTRTTPGAVRILPIACDVLEIAAFQTREADTIAAAHTHGLELPPFGRAQVSGARLALSVRPNRWLILGPATPPGRALAAGPPLPAELAAIIDQSSGLAAFYIDGPATREVLARGCRLDLDATVFPPFAAAATLIAQVAVTLVALEDGILLITPSTTARHFADWLKTSAAPFGGKSDAAAPLSTILCRRPTP